MFGIFKGKEQKISEIAAAVASILNMHFYAIRSDNNGDLPLSLQEDEYVLGYIFGVASAGAYVNNYRNNTDSGMFILKVFLTLFPEDGDLICSRCGSLAVTKEKKFMSGNNAAIVESKPIFMAMVNQDLEQAKKASGSLKSFKKHLQVAF